MTAKRHTFSGSTVDGSISFDDMRYNHERGYVAVTFYSDSALTTVVTPTDGTVTFTVSENGVNFGTIPNGTVTAINVGPLVGYERPNWAGSARAIKATFSGIAGAAFFKAEVTRFGD